MVEKMELYQPCKESSSDLALWPPLPPPQPTPTPQAQALSILLDDSFEF